MHSLKSSFTSLQLYVWYLFPLLFSRMQLKLPLLKRKNHFLFFCLFCVFSASLFLLNIWQFLCFLCVVFHIATEERTRIKGGGKKKLHMGKYELLLNPKNSVHSEELINKLNTMLWKQTPMHKCEIMNGNLKVIANHNINMSQQSNGVTKKPQILIFRKEWHKKWELIALFIQPLEELSHILVSRLRQCISRQIEQETNLKQPSPWVKKQKSKEI